jgi:hypothetical protein
MSATTVRLTLDVTIERRVEPDDSPDLSWLEQECWNEDTGTEGSEGYGLRRIEDYNRGGWYMVGVYAVAVTDDGAEVARSGGLWGVESDSGEAYLDAVFAEETSELLSELTEKGWVVAS